MTKNELNIVNMLFELAQKSKPAFRARIAAAITLKKEVIAVGYNSTKTHPFQKKYSHHPDAICIHAENDAIMQALRTHSSNDLKQASIYVVRAKRTERDSNFSKGLAKPCEGCQRALASFGIKRVYYSTNEGTMECL